MLGDGCRYPPQQNDMKLTHVFVQSTDGSPDDEAFHKGWAGFRKRQIECSLVDSSTIENGSLSLTKTTLVVGGLRTVESAMRQIGMQMPVANNMPDELSAYFGREIRKTTLGHIRREWKSANPESCFLKPLDQNKLFPAIALFHCDDLVTLNEHEDSVPVIVSQYVLFESEWRAFVVHGEIVGLSHYQGDFFVFPNASTIKSAIEKFKSAPAGYGIDFGVLSDGRTVLVEANDGYSLGSYSLNPVDYTRLLEARWCELAA